MQITLQARLLGRSCLGRSTGRLEPEMLEFLIAQWPVRSAPGRFKNGTCEGGLKTQGPVKLAQITTIKITLLYANNTTQLSTKITLILKHKLPNKLKP